MGEIATHIISKPNEWMKN